MLSVFSFFKSCFHKAACRVEAVMWKMGTFNLLDVASEQEAMGPCD